MFLFQWKKSVSYVQKWADWFKRNVLRLAQIRISSLMCGDLNVAPWFHASVECLSLNKVNLNCKRCLCKDVNENSSALAKVCVLGAPSDSVLLNNRNHQINELNCILLEMKATQTPDILTLSSTSALWYYKKLVSLLESQFLNHTCVSASHLHRAEDSQCDTIGHTAIYVFI